MVVTLVTIQHSTCAKLGDGARLYIPRIASPGISADKNKINTQRNQQKRSF